MTVLVIRRRPQPDPLPAYRGSEPIRLGFTLVEILTVVVILGILTAIALPGLATQSNLSANAASRVMVGDLLYAQSQAVATGQYQYVSFTADNNQPGGGEGSYSLSSPFGTVITNPISRQPYTQTFGSGGGTPLADVLLTDVSLDAATNTVLVFNELGQPLVCAPNGTPVALANTGTFQLQSGSKIVTISIEPATGNITVSP